jgi:hypothetical protein
MWAARACAVRGLSLSSRKLHEPPRKAVRAGAGNWERKRDERSERGKCLDRLGDSTDAPTRLQQAARCPSAIQSMGLDDLSLKLPRGAWDLASLTTTKWKEASLGADRLTGVP